jgi:hypothetical protein
MAHKILTVALSLVVAAIPLSAANAAAPPAPPTAKYCLSMEPMTGSHIPTVQCRTRDEWAWFDINVDQEWTENGVAVIP